MLACLGPSRAEIADCEISSLVRHRTRLCGRGAVADRHRGHHHAMGAGRTGAAPRRDPGDGRQRVRTGRPLHRGPDRDAPGSGDVARLRHQRLRARRCPGPRTARSAGLEHRPAHAGRTPARQHPHPLGRRRSPRAPMVEVDATVARTKLPSVSDLYIGTASGGPLIRIVVPVLRHGQVILTLTASLPPPASGRAAAGRGDQGALFRYDQRSARHHPGPGGSRGGLRGQAPARFRGGSR